MATGAALGVPLHEEQSDPTFNPTRSNASEPAQRRVVPFEWVTHDYNQLNLLLNAVNYRAGHTFESGSVSPSITSPEQARAQLLRKDLGYRFRLGEISRAKKHKGPNFEKCVRQGLRWRGWAPSPWYSYLAPNGGHTPTNAEHQANVARSSAGSASASNSASASASTSSAAPVVIDLVDDDGPPAAAVAVGAAVQTGVVIPPKPALPPYPIMPMSKPKGPLYPVKHPFTMAQIKDCQDKNPPGFLRAMLGRLYDPVGSANNPFWMYKCIGFVCKEVDPATACLKSEEWIKRVLADLQWRGLCGDDFELRFGNREDAVKVLTIAYANKVLVFTPLDDGKVPDEYVTPEEAQKYTALKTKNDAEHVVYSAAHNQFKNWQKTYGALADTIIPPALDPNDEDVEMTKVNMFGTGKTAVEERKRKAAADIVCIDCNDPKCECVELTKPAPKTVKTEP